MIPASPGVPALLVSQAVMAIGMGFNSPALLALISRYSAADDQGGVLGLTQSLNSLARIVGPMWGGFAYDRLGVGVPYVSSAAVMAAAALIAVVSLWRTRTELAS
jgi:predicted MFS family arabinose efflux permease